MFVINFKKTWYNNDKVTDENNEIGEKIMKLKFFKCNHCGNVIVKTVDSGVPVMCCGEAMTELAANKEDAAVEKHVPAVTVSGDKIDVVVGDTVHPMMEAHYIQFICLETERGFQIRTLTHEDEPKAVFAVTDDKPVAVYELCNLHGLWVKEL